MLYLVVGLFGFFICITSIDEKRLLLRAVSCLLMINLLFHFRICFTCKCARTSRFILVKLPWVLCWTSNCIQQPYLLIALCSSIVSFLFEYLKKCQKGQLIIIILLWREDFRSGRTSLNYYSVWLSVSTPYSGQHSCSRGRIRNQKISREQFITPSSLVVTVVVASFSQEFFNLFQNIFLECNFLAFIFIPFVL